ncbi:THAP domain-containing protein 4 [Ooceraea biroi]|uniref:THAP domain-containing protein 4 n=1 Tax=Ooceraea biroi TaxID=2015173 RepID=UPI000F095B86|nr:THAP domain-containing protein 4 [Ooceraea biroi]
MVRCCFGNSILTKGCERTFHRFLLSDKFMLEQWLKQIPMKHWTPNKDSLLCSDHFTENCFNKSAFQVRLKSDSVPTRFGDPQTACIICKWKRSHESMHSFFKFPLDKPVLLNRWLENMNLLNWTPTQSL